MSRRFRLTVVLTHPIQYYDPWFRFIVKEVPELDLNVVYASEPTPEQQGVGFGRAFVWDVPLREGYRNVVVRPSTTRSRFDSNAFWGLDAPEINKAIDRSKPDVVLLSGWHSISLVRAMRSCRRRSVPMLYRGDTQIGGRSAGPKHWLWRLRTRWLLGHFDRFLSVGSRAREYLRSFGIPEDLIYASPHAVDNDFFAKSSAPFRIPAPRARVRLGWELGAEDYVVLFVGKLEAKKRPLDPIRALAIGERKATLLVVGKGALEEKCRRLSSDLGIAVRWAGFLNQSELGKAYAAADCLVLPSDWGESWGLVVNEAMASGLPCVVSDRAGCAPDLIDEGRTGFTYPAGDVRALSEALVRLYEYQQQERIRPEYCQEKVRGYSYGAATSGLLSACCSLRP